MLWTIGLFLARVCVISVFFPRFRPMFGADTGYVVYMFFAKYEGSLISRD